MQLPLRLLPPSPLCYLSSLQWTYAYWWEEHQTRWSSRKVLLMISPSLTVSSRLSRIKFLGNIYFTHFEFISSIPSLTQINLLATHLTNNITTARVRHCRRNIPHVSQLMDMFSFNNCADMTYGFEDDYVMIIPNNISLSMKSPIWIPPFPYSDL